MTHEEIKNQIVEYRQDNGLPKLSPSRLRNQAENYARQLAPLAVRDRNDPTGSEAAERESIIKDSSPEVSAEWCVSYPHGSLAVLTARYSTERDKEVSQ